MLFEQILSLIPCAVFWKDATGAFRGCNRQYLEFAGIPDKNDVIGKTDKELPWADRWEEYYQDDRDVFLTGKTISRIEQVTLPNKKITAHTTKTPWFKDGIPVGILGVIYDISELIEAKEQAETANFLKTEFIQNMQHDIRTPASGIWAVLSAMAEEEENPLMRKKLILLRNSAKQLYNICNDIIDFDRIERGEIPITSRKISIRKIIEDVVALNLTVAYKKKLDLSFSIDEQIPLVLKGDKHRISRILINLVGNAIKFTDHGSVKIVAKLLKLVKKEVIVQFEIHDTGSGIPEDKKNLIYEKFSRGTSASRRSYTGSGLGLQIVKKFVTDLDGEIDVYSEPNKRTTFYISIPLEKPLVSEIYDENDDVDMHEVSLDDNEIEETLEFETTVKDKFSMKILLIEDDLLAQIVGQNLIQSTQNEAVIAATMQKALDVLENQQFDLVISDLGLPDGSGYEIVRSVKGNSQSLNYKTPFVALTAHVDKKIEKEAQESGFFRVLLKPLMKDQIVSLIEYGNANKNKEQSPIFDKKIIDLELTANLTGQNENFALNVFETLCAGLPSDIENIKIAQQQNDIKKLRELFHKLSGALSYCGAPRLLEATNTLHETLKEATSLSDLTNRFNTFYKEAETLLQEYSRYKKFSVSTDKLGYQ